MGQVQSEGQRLHPALTANSCGCAAFKVQACQGLGPAFAESPGMVLRRYLMG